MSLVLCGAVESFAQNRYSKSTPRNTSSNGCDSVLLSQRRDGNYMVRRYRVKHDCDRNNDFAVHYRINLSTMSPTLGGNSSELAALNAFMDSLTRDSLIHVHSVTITGYASPDGLEASNLRLAKARAADFRNYLDKKYGLSNKYNVNIEAVVDDWDSCLSALDKSKIEGSDKAAAIIRRKDGMAAKERELKSMPQVWNYLAANVLPPLRQADIEFEYGRDDIAETRVLVAEKRPAARPAPATKPQPQPVQNDRCCCCGEDMNANIVVVDDMTNGLIVEMGAVDIDY